MPGTNGPRTRSCMDVLLELFFLLFPFFFPSLKISHFVPLITPDPPVLWRTIQRHHGVGRISDMLDVGLSVYIIFSSPLFPFCSLTRSLFYLFTCLKNLRHFDHLMHPVPEQHPALELEHDIDTGARARAKLPLYIYRAVQY